MADLRALLCSVLADRYRVELMLGRGGMAVVYLAEDLKHHRQVAIKVLLPELASAVGVERFLREIQIAAGLAHPNILPLHDSGDADGLPYYVMPYVEGESIRVRLKREKQLPVEEALRITREVADGLYYAHSLGIVHRDIKPGNILVEAGHAVVMDFGIARAVSGVGRERLTATGLTLGTPAYMSPEQFDESGTVDHRSDIYSLGCVLYEMLAGRPPFMGSTVQAMLEQHALEPVPSVRSLRSAVPPGVERTITKALAKAPADRFPDAGQMADALEAASK